MEDYKNFIQSQVIDFERNDIESLQNCEKEINAMIKSLNIHITPSLISFIKTTGFEEADAGYTRDNCIIVPAAKFQNTSGFLFFICHELFHVFSRFNPEIREKLYNVIGFQLVPDLIVDEFLTENRVTNPDASDYRFGIELNGNICVPFVYSDPYTIGNKELKSYVE